MKDRLKGKITLINTISTLFLQITMLLSGFVIPKLILDAFGSNVNGLVSSLSQFLNYIALVEGGVTGVITATLYRPLARHDDSRVSSILSAAKRFYKKIGLIFIVYTIILAIVYPLIFRTEFSFVYVASLTLILSISLIIQYMMALSYKTLLNADKKIYIVSFTQALIRILEIILAFLSIKIYPDIHLLKFLTGAVFLLHYKVDANMECDNSIIKGRWNGFAINTAAFIHNSTDVAVLTIFTNLATVSIYSVYSLITTGIKNIINSLVSSLNPTLGHAYAREDYKALNQKLDMYEYIVFMLVFQIFTVAGLLITSFVLIYTSGLSDANYNQPLFGVLLVISEALYLLKFPHLNLAYSANKFKEISIPAFVEAGLNIIISVALVPFLGLIGVAIGTIIAMLYRMVFHVYYTSEIVPGRRQWIFYRKLMLFLTASGFGVIICLLIPSCDGSVIGWVWHAILYSIVIGLMLILTSFCFFREEIRNLKNYLKRR